ncbi:MAG: hypothetical protein JWL96_45 [Sphingomonas bacterium]|uniref:DUF1761 domain-containing protein n=1 Tax=Sphingomonas bacterium TaxID=1895847 RepID=UPI00262CE1DF|nr:DUF1761 domain-containing protein [Sphingomonas bacterium]MDB5707975.1 hypothetical protein [Sphingomonas bacterium]
MQQINLVAALVGGVIGFFPGALWYSNLMFLPRWAREMGIDLANPPEKKNHGREIAIGLFASLVAAVVFALIAGPAPALDHALLLALACAGLIGTAFAIQYLFERRSLAFWAINASYHLVQFLLFAVVIALWH